MTARDLRDARRVTELTDAQIEAIVADAMASEASHARSEAAPPSGAIVWWRAQMRARREAAQLAEKPIDVVHALAIACGVGVALSLAGIAVAAVRGSFGWLKDAAAFVAPIAAPFAALDLSGPWITLSLTATLVFLVIVSIAAFFVLADE
jgi:hypothetical protein